MNYPELYRPEIAVISGGSGGAAFLPGLIEAMPDVNMTVVVPTGDSGSATGELRRQFGGPAVGDIRKVMSAVSGNKAGQLFGERFGEQTSTGDLRTHADLMLGVLAGNGKQTTYASHVVDRAISLAEQLPPQQRETDGEVRMVSPLWGHTFGNLILTSMMQEHDGDILPGIKTANEWLDTRARVLPVTTEPHNVIMHDKVRNVMLRGEGVIDEYHPADPSQVDVWLEATSLLENSVITDPDDVAAYLKAREVSIKPQASAESIAAIATSDCVLLIPGSFDTTHKPALLPEGIADGFIAQEAAGGLWVAIANLVAEKHGLDLRTHLGAVQEVSGRSITHLIHNTQTDNLPEGTVPLRFDPETYDLGDAVAIGAALVDSRLVKVDDSDPIGSLRNRSQHNPWRVAEVLRDIVRPS